MRVGDKQEKKNERKKINNYRIRTSCFDSIEGEEKGRKVTRDDDDVYYVHAQWKIRNVQRTAGYE